MWSLEAAMQDFSFRRPPNWSTAYAASRVEESLRRCRVRIAAIDAEKAELDAEATKLKAFEVHLGELLQVELAARDRHAAKRSAVVHRQPIPPVARVAGGPATAADFAAAVTHTGKREYHRGGKFFPPKGWAAAAGSTAPKRYDVSSVESDRDLLRLVKMIEVPGLIHAMVMAEKAQKVIDVEAVSVPENSLGINLSDAYSEHIFSLEAYKTLIDPMKGDPYLDKLQAGVIPSGDS